MNYKQLAEPMVGALRQLDAKTPGMDKVLQIMRNVEAHVMGLRDPPFSLPLENATAFEKSFRARREMIEMDLPYAGALLNPYLLYDKVLADDQDAVVTTRRVLGKMNPEGIYADVVKEFVAFRHKEFSFHDMVDPRGSKLSTHA